ncbi:MAG: hypothetical protein ACXAE3_04430 [Candidatus Kariarchaeaceae archaeon]|jgi:hypothetical protein
MAVNNTIKTVVVLFLLFVVPSVTVNYWMATDPLSDIYRAEFSLSFDPSNGTSTEQLLAFGDFPELTQINIYLNRTGGLAGFQPETITLYYLQGNFYDQYLSGTLAVSEQFLSSVPLLPEEKDWFNVTQELPGNSYLLFDASSIVTNTTISGFFEIIPEGFWTRNLLNLLIWAMSYIIVVFFLIPSSYSQFRKNQYLREKQRERDAEEDEFYERMRRERNNS